MFKHAVLINNQRKNIHQLSCGYFLMHFCLFFFLHNESKIKVCHENACVLKK